jgi:anti-sigma-K factor RskA
MLDIDGLPPPPDDHDYQVWAIVDGTPVDLGVLDSQLGIHRMRSIADATAFTVTIETLGGNPVPNLDRMVLLGEV